MEKKNPTDIDEDELADLLDECSLEMKQTKEEAKKPSIATVTDDLNEGQNVNFGDMPFSTDQQKMMEEMMGKLFSGMDGGGANPGDGADPMLMCTKMFEDFEKITKENAKTEGASGAAGPAAGPGGADEADTMAQMLQGLAKDLLSGNDDKAMDGLLKEFSTFLESTGENNDM